MPVDNHPAYGEQPADELEHPPVQLANALSPRERSAQAIVIRDHWKEDMVGQLTERERALMVHHRFQAEVGKRRRR